MKGCFVCKKEGRLEYVFRQKQQEAISREVEMPEAVINQDNYMAYREFLREVEVIFCTWDMVAFTKEEIREFFPRLKVVFYAAASVQYFARPFLELGVRVITCHKVMAVPVAEFTVAQLVLANKGALRAMRAYSRDNLDAGRLSREVYPGSYATRVGILGAGAIGAIVVKMLRQFHMEVLVYDPFLTPAGMGALGIDRTCSLEEIFESCHTISNHLANNEKTVGMLNYSLFQRMAPNAAFLNTGRGAQVVEADLVRALREEPMRTAYLDVTYPEPPGEDSPFWTMENVFLTPHVAGYAEQEVLMFSDFMIAQLQNYKAQKPFGTETVEVSLEMLETLA